VAEAGKNDLLSFTESAIFTRQLHEIASLDVLFAIQADLLQNPTRGDVIQHTYGARKARVGDPARAGGKRGGYRYLYYYVEHQGRIFLLFLFSKREQANLSPKQAKEISKLVDHMKGLLK
jgi:hypothetical protein